MIQEQEGIDKGGYRGNNGKIRVDKGARRDGEGWIKKQYLIYVERWIKK